MDLCLLLATTADWVGYKKKKQATRLSPAYHQPKSKSRLFRIFLALKLPSTEYVLCAETPEGHEFMQCALCRNDIEMLLHIMAFVNVFFISGRFW